MQLSGKVALVTGAARGIGRGVALELAKAGADICVTDRASAPQAAEVAAAIQGLGRRAIVVQADVSERGAVERTVAQCTANLAPVDILVAAAVTSVRQTLLETREADLRQALDVSILGTFHAFQVVARQMVERRAKGSLIYITSPHARLPFKGAMDYNTAKAGAHQLALSAANELMWYGIRVNLIEPGWTDTPGERTWYSDEALYREGAKLPLGRLATPEDIGRAAVFLASDDAAYVAGAVLRVDGGAFIQGPAWSAPARHGGEESVGQGQA
ncbi:MAG TPA: SDR family oxidoreductase [Candidatus Methylomirabilis sp.]|nr:SDR family oxidoreductase [Candidatus Methylomirabilis sp.]